MMRMFIWELEDWPNLVVDAQAIAPLLSDVRFKQGQLLGVMSRVGFKNIQQAQLGALTDEVTKSSEIEGEILDREDVRSSIGRRLGVDTEQRASSPRVEGTVEVMMDAVHHYTEPLTQERLYGWHAALFPTGFSGMKPIEVGRWRTDAHGPMQVVSGPIGRQRIHYEAPPASRVEGEMHRFLDWFNSPPDMDAVVWAALAHFRFVTIHPFEDGNGRLARVIADMALARSEGSAQRFYSMSAQIRAHRKSYYAMLEQTQRGSLDVTPWIAWFLQCLAGAISNAGEVTREIFSKSAFWERHSATAFNERQITILNLLLTGFNGKLTAVKWARITKCSPATAQRDIHFLVEKGILRRGPGGSKNTWYELEQIHD